VQNKQVVVVKATMNLPDCVDGN